MVSNAKPSDMQHRPARPPKRQLVDTDSHPDPPERARDVQVAVDETRRTAALNAPVKARADALSFYYGEYKALKDLNMEIRDKQVTALIGPSGCGKSTFLRCFNRMHDLTPGTRYEGRIMLLPEDIDLVARNVDPIEVRMRIGMVFQKPNPFPEVDLRECRLRAAHPRRALAHPHPGRGREGAARRGAVG